jgi:probable phosphoglycerate mutase
MFVVRHSETLANTHSVFQGHTDSSLTPTGVIQAGSIARTLKKYDCKRIVSSDLKRAAHTASLIAERTGLEVTEDKDLREVYFGLWDGLPAEAIKKIYNAAWNERQGNKWAWNGYEGESYLQAFERANKWLINNYNEQTIVVCHGTFGKILRGAYAGLSPEEIMSIGFEHTDIFQLLNGEIYER